MFSPSDNSKKNKSFRFQYKLNYWRNKDESKWKKKSKKLFCNIFLRSKKKTIAKNKSFILTILKFPSFGMWTCLKYMFYKFSCTKYFRFSCLLPTTTVIATTIATTTPEWESTTTNQILSSSLWLAGCGCAECCSIHSLRPPTSNYIISFYLKCLHKYSACVCLFRSFGISYGVWVNFECSTSRISYAIHQYNYKNVYRL